MTIFVPGSMLALFKIFLSRLSDVTLVSLLEISRHLDQKGNASVIVFIVPINVDLLVLN